MCRHFWTFPDDDHVSIGFAVQSFGKKARASTFERVLNSNLNYFANGGTTGSTVRLTETESGFGPVYDVTIPLLFEKRNTSIDPQMYIIFLIPDELGHTTGVFQYMFSIDLPAPNDLALEYIFAS